MWGTGFGCSVACGIFLDWESSLCPLHWQAHSYPLYHQVQDEALSISFSTLQLSKHTHTHTHFLVFKELDINQDGGINLEEFLVLVIKVGLVAHEEIHKE